MRTGAKKAEETGLRTRVPRLLTGGTSRAADCALSFLLTVLGVFGTAWAFLSSFSLEILPLTFFLSGFVFLLAFSAAFSFRKAGYALFPAYASFYGLALWREQASVAQGFRVAANRVIAVYSDRLNYALPSFQVEAPAAQQPWLCTLFLLFCLFLLCGFVGWAIFRRKSFWLTFLLTIPFLAPAWFLTITPDFTAMLMILVCWATLGLLRLQKSGKKGFVLRRSAYRAKNGASAARTGLLLMPCVALCLAAILAVCPQSSYRRPGFADTLRTDLTDSFTQESFFGGSRSLSGNTVRVDLRNANGVHFTGKTALQIKADGQYPLYLKNFAAGIYTGSGWQLYPDADYETIDRELGAVNVQNMLHTFETLLGQQDETALDPYYLQVKNVAAAKQCIYAPYNLITAPSDITGVKFIHDGFIRSGMLFGTASYSLYAYGFSADKIHTAPASVPLSLLLAAKGQSALNDFTGEYRWYSTQFLNSADIAQYYKQTTPQNLLDRITDPNQQAFVKKEQAYRLFMYDKYTQLPDSAREQVQALLMRDGRFRRFFTGAESGSSGTYGRLQVSAGYSDPYQIVNAVKEYLGENFSYTLSPDAVPKGQDFAAYFLTQSRRGYCVHFATAAAVMLRVMGIPTRYAEGYIVTPDDYKTAGSDGWANIPDSRAHSWVEVYNPGLGWEPVEVTPGFNVEESQTQGTETQDQPRASSSAPTSSAVSSSLVSSAAPSSAPSGTESAAASSAPQETQANDAELAAWPVVFLAAAVFLLAAAGLARRKIVLALRRKRFLQKNANRAVLCIYAFLKQLEPFGGTISEEAERAALKARFSRNPVTEEEREAMRVFALSLVAEVFSRLKGRRRFAFRYIFALI